MENSEIFKTMKRQWNILINGSYLDGIENSGIFKTMKRQWNAHGAILASRGQNNKTR
jgi:hypothetical protein